MNFFRKLLARFAREAKRPAEAASPPVPVQVAQNPNLVLFPFAVLARSPNCSCRICTGSVDMRTVTRLTVGMAQRIDQLMIGVAVGKFPVGCLQIQHWAESGIGSQHVVVCNDAQFAKIERALRESPQ